MCTEDKVRLHPEYELRVADLMTPVEIAEDFTLGNLCRIIDNFEEMDRETFSALLQCPLEPFLEECLRLGDTGTEPRSDLRYIRLFWECEYDLRTETRWPPVTSMGLHVDGIGETWEDYRPGGRFYEEGRDYSQCNGYAIELTPLYALRHLPLRIDPVMTLPGDGPSRRPDEIADPAGVPPVWDLHACSLQWWEVAWGGRPRRTPR